MTVDHETKIESIDEMYQRESNLSAIADRRAEDAQSAIRDAANAQGTARQANQALRVALRAAGRDEMANNVAQQFEQCAAARGWLMSGPVNTGASSEDRAAAIERWHAAYLANRAAAD